jgi:hypothetical protein
MPRPSRQVPQQPTSAPWRAADPRQAPGGRSTAAEDGLLRRLPLSRPVAGVPSGLQITPLGSPGGLLRQDSPTKPIVVKLEVLTP